MQALIPKQNNSFNEKGKFLVKFRRLIIAKIRRNRCWDFIARTSLLNCWKITYADLGYNFSSVIICNRNSHSHYLLLAQKSKIKIEKYYSYQILITMYYQFLYMYFLYRVTHFNLDSQITRNIAIK